MSRWVWRFLLSCFVCGVTQTVSFLIVLPPTTLFAGRNNDINPATTGGCLDYQSTWIPQSAETVSYNPIANNDDDPRYVILKSGGGPSQRSNHNPSRQQYQIVPISQFFQLGYTLQDITLLTCDTAAILLSQRVPRPSAPLPITWTLSSTGSSTSSTTTTSAAAAAPGNNSSVPSSAPSFTTLDESGLLVATNKSQAERLVADLTQSTTTANTTSNPTNKALDAMDSRKQSSPTTTSWRGTPPSTRTESNQPNKDASSATTSRTPFLQVSPQEFVSSSLTPMRRRTTTTTQTQTLERGDSLNIVSSPTNSNQTEMLQNDVSVLLYTDWQGNLSYVPTANLTRLGYSVDELCRLHTTALDRIVLGKIVRPHPGIPIRWNSIVGESDTVEWVPTMQVAQAKLEQRHKRMVQQQKIRLLQTEQATKNDRGDPPPPKSSWLVDMRTYRKQLRESAAFRLKWLGKSWAPWIQQEANLRLDLYKNFLWAWHDYVEGGDDYRHAEHGTEKGVRTT